jgi:hypothetical protein
VTHPAILKAQELYDSEVDELAQYENDLIREVNRIGGVKARDYGLAQRMFGDVPKQYRACLIEADETARKDMDAAKAYFDLAHAKHLEDRDALEAVGVAMQDAAE